MEIGVWKSLFIQLLRLLEAIKKPFLNDLNGRYVVLLTIERGSTSKETDGSKMPGSARSLHSEGIRFDDSEIMSAR